MPEAEGFSSVTESVKNHVVFFVLTPGCTFIAMFLQQMYENKLPPLPQGNTISGN